MPLFFTRSIEMKLCPNCGEQLHQEAHFCPKCLYRFEKAELDEIIEHKSAEFTHHRRWGIVVAAIVLIVAGVIDWAMLPHREKSDMPEMTYEEVFPQEPETGEKLTYQMDCNDMLVPFSELQLMLGEETEEVQVDGEYEIHTYGNLTVGVNANGDVQYVCVEDSDPSNHDRYGIMGIGCGTSRENTKLLLGTPRQEYGDSELIYDFYREEEPYHTYLHIYFDESGMVEQWEYYEREAL